MVKLVWELLKKQSVAMVSYLVVGSRLHSKYRLRLLAMLSVVFGAFSFAIVAITWSKGTGTPEPFVLDGNSGSSHAGDLFSAPGGAAAELCAPGPREKF